jgi:nucleoid DNA-binding protein
MATLTKKELADRIAKRIGEKHVVVRSIIQHFIDEVILELRGGNRLE